MTAPRLLGVVVSLALGIAVAAGAQRPIETTLDPTTITVGDPVRLVVSVTHVPADTVSWPEPPALAPFEVIGQRAVPPTTSDGRTVSTLELTLTAFELGRLEVPSFDIVVTGASGDPATLSTDPLAVSVDTVGLDEGGDIRDIKAPIGIPFDPLTLAPWLTLGAQPTTICLINEPAPGSLVNMRVDETEDGLDALLVTGRPIAAGEELYLDYGKKYDRSDYGQF